MKSSLPIHAELPRTAHNLLLYFTSSPPHLPSKFWSTKQLRSYSISLWSPLFPCDSGITSQEGAQPLWVPTAVGWCRDTSPLARQICIFELQLLLVPCNAWVGAFIKKYNIRTKKAFQNRQNSPRSLNKTIPCWLTFSNIYWSWIMPVRADQVLRSHITMALNGDTIYYFHLTYIRLYILWWAYSELTELHKEVGAFWSDFQVFSLFRD